MNTLNNHLSKLIILVLILFIGQSINAQTNINQQINENDTLSLNQIMATVIKNHPIIKNAEESVNKADAQIGLAKSGYYPNVDASVNASNVGPVPSFTFPSFGTFELFPRYNFDASVNIHQNIYDFGKTSTNVKFSDKSKELAETSVETAKQNMAKNVIRNYYNLLFLQEAIKIKDEELKILNEHLENVKKKKETGSGTDYDILSTQVKISNIENQKLDIESSHEIQLSVLNALLGLPAETYHTVKDTLVVQQPDLIVDTAISYAFNHRNEILLAKDKIKLEEIHLNMVKVQNRPALNAVVEGGWKNGYAPEIDKIKANYVIGLGLKVPIFDGTRTKYNKLLAQSSVESNIELDITKRKISNEVIASQTKLKTALKKLEQSKLQLHQAQEAFKLAQTNYSLGAITNLDLLDATKNVSESKLMVLKSKIDYTISLYLYKTSLGEVIY